MSTREASDKVYLNMFRSCVREYNRLLKIEGTLDQEIYEDFYGELISVIERLKEAFDNLTENKKKARSEFNPDKITKKFIKRLEKKERALQTA